jgi:hypothetical protein
MICTLGIREGWQMRQILMLLVVAVTACPTGAFADQEKAIRLFSTRYSGQFRNTLAGIERGTELRLTLRDKSVLTGRLDRVGERALYVMDSRTGTVTQVAIRSLEQLEWWPDPSLKTQIIVLTGVAVAVLLVGLSAR